MSGSVEYPAEVRGKCSGGKVTDRPPVASAEIYVGSKLEILVIYIGIFVIDHICKQCKLCGIGNKIGIARSTLATRKFGCDVTFPRVDVVRSTESGDDLLSKSYGVADRALFALGKTVFVLSRLNAGKGYFGMAERGDALTRDLVTFGANVITVSFRGAGRLFFGDPRAERVAFLCAESQLDIAVNYAFKRRFYCFLKKTKRR